MIYSEQKDEILVSLTLLGNQEAYEALVIRWQRAVLSVARNITHSEPLAEDAAQDAFVSAWLKLNTLKDGSKYGAWVCNIARNRSKNLLMQYREWVDVNWIAAMEDKEPDALFFATPTLEQEELRESVSALTEKVKTVITLHYFEGYSIAEIAQMLSIPQNTVKARLHQGRLKLRKEYGLMNEKDTDTLVQKVMKKVEELKLWHLRDNKEGFEAVYRDTLCAIEALPDSTEKDYALADTLKLGYWWVDGENTQKVFERIKDVALKSKNEEVLQFVALRESGSLRDADKIEFMEKTQIPQMEKLGLQGVQGCLWFWIGFQKLELGMRDEGLSAIKKATQILPASKVYHACALAALYAEERGNVVQDRIKGTAVEYRYLNGELRFWSEPGYSRGPNTFPTPSLGYYATLCENRFRTDKLRLGETMRSENGKCTLTFLSNTATVITPAGTFDHCEEWMVTAPHTDVYTYYKEGVGIVRQKGCFYPDSFDWVLSNYEILGGSGMMPLQTGNRWDYTPNYEDLGLSPEHVKCIAHQEVTYADDKKAILTNCATTARISYDHTSWDDTIDELREKYCYYDANEGCYHYADASKLLQSAKSLADSPSKKLICAGIERLITCVTAGEKRLTATPAHENYFNRFNVREVIDGDKLDDMRMKYKFNINTMPFEDWTPGTWEDRHPLIYSDVYSILYDAANTLWSEEWKPGASYEMKPHLKYFKNISGKIIVSDGGSITTPAGTFDHCLCLHIEPKGFEGFWPGDVKDYYFAPGVGIIKTVHYYGNNAERRAVYELTHYEGACEGYLSFAPGMKRTFEAQGMTGGYVGRSEHHLISDEEGRLLMLSQTTGIRTQIPE